MSDNMSIKIEMADDSKRLLFQIAKDFPNRFRSDFMGVAIKYRNVFSKAMREEGHPKYGIPKFAPIAQFTEQRKAREGVNKTIWDGKKHSFGTDGKYHKWWPSGSSIYVGFPDNEGLADHMSRWMEALSYPTSKEQRRVFHMRYKGFADPPRMYDRPERHVIEPLADYLNAGAFANDIIERFQKWYRKKYCKEYVGKGSASYKDIQLAFGSQRMTSQATRRSVNAQVRAQIKRHTPAAIERANHGW